MGGSSSTQITSGFMMNNSELNRQLPILQLMHYEAEVQGRRPSMEDESCAGVLDPQHFPHIVMYAVFDGHGGKECAHYARKHLATHITRQLLGVLARIASEFHIDPKTGAPLPASATPSPVFTGLGLTERKGDVVIINAPFSARAHSYASSDTHSSGSSSVDPALSAAGHDMKNAIVPGDAMSGRRFPRLLGSTGFPPPDITIDTPEASKINNLWYRSINILHLGACAAASAFADLDQAWFMGKGAKLEAGCTAVVVLIDTLNSYLLCLNAGDARAFLCRKGACISLSKIHSPSQPLEKARILDATGIVTNGRLNGVLAVSRALGDRSFKRAQDPMSGETLIESMRNYPNSKYIPSYDISQSGRNPWTFACSSQPDYSAIGLSAALGDEFIVLACDGLYDVMTESEVIDFVRCRLQQIQRTTTYIGVTTPLVSNTDHTKGQVRPTLYRDITSSGSSPDLLPWPHETWIDNAYARAESYRARLIEQGPESEISHAKLTLQGRRPSGSASLLSQPSNVQHLGYDSPSSQQRRHSLQSTSSSTLAPTSAFGSVGDGSGSGSGSGGSPATNGFSGPEPTTPTHLEGGERDRSGIGRTPGDSLSTPGKFARAQSYREAGSPNRSTGTPGLLNDTSRKYSIPRTASPASTANPVQSPASASPSSSHLALGAYLSPASSSGSAALPVTPPRVMPLTRAHTTTQTNPSSLDSPRQLRSNFRIQVQPAMVAPSLPSPSQSPSSSQPSSQASAPASGTPSSSYPQLTLALPSSASRSKYASQVTVSNSTSLTSSGSSLEESLSILTRSPSGSLSASPSSPSLSPLGEVGAIPGTPPLSARTGLVAPEAFLQSAEKDGTKKVTLGEILANYLIPGACLCGSKLQHASAHARDACEKARNMLIDELNSMPSALARFALNASHHCRGLKMNPRQAPISSPEFDVAVYNEYDATPTQAEQQKLLPSIAQALCDEAIRRGTRDNVSVIIVFLRFPQIPHIQSTAAPSSRNEGQA